MNKLSKTSDLKRWLKNPEKYTPYLLHKYNSMERYTGVFTKLSWFVFGFGLVYISFLIDKGGCGMGANETPSK